MREKMLFVCEVCNTEYKDRAEAERCEDSHLPLKSLKIVGAKYIPTPMNSRVESWPSKITLKSPTGGTREYRA